MVKKILIFFLIFFLQPIFAEEISGFPKIIDGDTIKIGESKIRLEGIDAPEMRQICEKPFLQISYIIGLSFNKDYKCGVVSKEKLLNKIKKSKIRCTGSSKDKYKRYLATCYKDRTNLNKWMVRQGYAVAYKKYSNRYLIDEQYAKENKLGIWKGTFLRPEKWRKLN
tara:strand:+ start:13 stop:513 length:501 start_codon:yes stop_codon:yes gene_type:complete